MRFTLSPGPAGHAECRWRYMMPILVVEDDLATREGLLELLAMEGFSPHGVGSLESAIEAIKNKAFVLVICDFDLGSGSGPQLFEFMKGAGISTPFLLFSAGKPEVASLFCGPAFFGMIRKPDTDRLLARIHEILGTARVPHSGSGPAANSSRL